MIPGAEFRPADVLAEVLRVEASAILAALDRIDSTSVARAVDLIVGCTGKVVVSGVGKSGIVARKIAATLSSTGTPAVFLHASDAAHGDLGLVQLRDVGLFVSQSGESDELLALIPHLRARTIRLIALTGDPESTLAKAADAVLLTGIDKEACPHNLAPTASTAVALALGDGLALACMGTRGFTAEDFARNHPAGRLGKRLTLRVADLMRAGADNPAIPPDASWTEVISRMCRYSLGALNVTDPAGRLLGLITDGDIRRAAERTPADRLITLRAEDMMTRSPVTVDPDCLAFEAIRIMEDRPSQISVLPVVNASSGICLGVLRLHDVLRSGIL